MLSKRKLKKIKSKVVLSVAILTLGLLLIYAFTNYSAFVKRFFSLSSDIKQLNASYEPSAVQQLSNGSVVVLEDEVSRALSLLEFDTKGNLLEDSIRDQQLNAQLKESFDDLEGVALSDKNEIYATTSFSRTGKGKQRPNREKLLRLALDEKGDIIRKHTYPAFAKALEKSQLFQQLDEISEDGRIRIKDINIEGLSFDKNKRQLLFGLKKPLVNDLSVIIYLENPQQVLDGEEQPVLAAEATLLDLLGGGIRSLSYDHKLQGYLIANEVNFGGGPKQSQLWFWSGDKEQDPVTLLLPETERMENIEAISAVTVAGEARVLLMSDDGSRKNKRAAHYITIDYDQIESQISR